MCRRRVGFERHEVRFFRAEADEERGHLAIDRGGLRGILVHRLLDRAHARLADAAVVAGDEHRPLRDRHEGRVVDAEAHRQCDRALRRGEARRVDARRDVPEQGGLRIAGEARGPS